MLHIRMSTSVTCNHFQDDDEVISMRDHFVFCCQVMTASTVEFVY
jgi:hypothetical protein